MNTTAIETRTHATSAKKSNENRVYINGTVAGKNLRAREVQNRPENEDLIRGFNHLFGKCRREMVESISDLEIQGVICSVFPKYQGVEIL